MSQGPKYLSLSIHSVVMRDVQGWRDLRESDRALPEKNEWNEESPTAGKSGKRPYRATPPSRQSSLYYRRLARSGKNKLKGKWARLESRPANSPDSFGSASSSV